MQARLTATQAGLGVMGVFVPPYAVEDLTSRLRPLRLEIAVAASGIWPGAAAAAHANQRRAATRGVAAHGEREWPRGEGLAPLSRQPSAVRADS